MNAKQISDFAIRLTENMTPEEIHGFNRSVWYSEFAKTSNNKQFDTYSAIVELIDSVESAVIAKRQTIRKAAKTNNSSKAA